MPVQLSVELQSIAHDSLPDSVLIVPNKTVIIIICYIITTNTIPSDVAVTTYRARLSLAIYMHNIYYKSNS